MRECLLALKQIRAYKVSTAFEGVRAMSGVFASEAAELMTKSPK